MGILWDNDNDQDLHVIEPDRTRIWYAAPGPSATGGRLDRDDNVGVCGRDTDAWSLPEAIERVHPDTGVVVIGVRCETADIVGWAECGVAGILTEDDGLVELDAVAATVAAGKAACSGPVAGVLLRGALSGLGPDRARHREDW